MTSISDEIISDELIGVTLNFTRTNLTFSVFTTTWRTLKGKREVKILLKVHIFTVPAGLHQITKTSNLFPLNFYEKSIVCAPHSAIWYSLRVTNVLSLNQTKFSFCYFYQKLCFH